MLCKLKKNDINDTIENDYKAPTKRMDVIRQQICLQQQKSCYLSVNNNPTFIKGLKMIHVLKKVMLHKKKKTQFKYLP